MTSFDLAAIVSELKEKIIGSRIENIYHLNVSTLLLSIHPQCRLIVEAGRRAHSTVYDVEKPASPSGFCQNLRRYLRNGVIKDVRMEGFERILVIDVSGKEASFRLVVELFGDGNFILLDGESRILMALTYRKMRDRDIVRGEAFKLPPARGFNPLEITRQQMDGLKGRGDTVIRSLTTHISMGGLYGEETLLRAQIDKKRMANTLSDEEIDQIYNAVAALSSDLTSKRQPQIIVDAEGKWIDALPFSLSAYNGFEKKVFSTFNEAADEYFTKLGVREREAEDSGGVSQQVEEQRRILLQQNEHLKELMDDTEKAQRIGDLIQTYAVELQGILQSIMERRGSEEDWNQIVSTLKKERSTSVLDSIDSVRRMAVIKIDDSQFELDIRENVYRNAARFYETSKEAKEKIEGLKTAIAETEKKIRDATLIKAHAEGQATEIAKIREKLWFEKFHWSKSSEGFLIIGGRDASTNELLVRRHMASDDIVLHAEFSGAPFVLIKTEGKQPSEKTINEAAQLAAAYSRAWRESVGSLDVYWVSPSQVSKGAPSGEYLSRGMFMIYGQKNYVHDVPLRVSIGIVKEDDRLTVIGGPVSAVAAQSQYRVEIIPGRRKSGELAKEIRYSLAKMAPAELHDAIQKLSLDDLQQFIPAGGGSVE